MHIPDGFLDPGVAAVTGVAAAGAVAYSLKRANASLEERAVPLLGVTGAFVFAAQMLNFPVAGGTSGHFLGAALAAVLLGPWGACLVLTVVLTIQAFAFADGGIAALGANVLNMGVLGGLMAGAVIAAGQRLLPASRPAFLASVAVASWLAVMLGAFATAIELGISDTVPLGTVLPAMLGVHALIGLGEAVITTVAVGAVLTSRPDLVGALSAARARALAPRPVEA